MTCMHKMKLFKWKNFLAVLQVSLVPTRFIWAVPSPHPKVNLTELSNGSTCESQLVELILNKRLNPDSVRAVTPDYYLCRTGHIRLIYTNTQRFLALLRNDRDTELSREQLWSSALCPSICFFLLFFPHLCVCDPSWTEQRGWGRTATNSNSAPAAAHHSNWSFISQLPLPVRWQVKTTKQEIIERMDQAGDFGKICVIWRDPVRTPTSVGTHTSWLS